LRTPGRKSVKILGRRQANIMDYKPLVNIMPFGHCLIRDAACMPSIAMPWIKGKNDTLVDGAPALLNISQVACFTGGTISIVHDGQWSINWDRLLWEGGSKAVNGGLLLWIGIGALKVAGMALGVLVSATSWPIILAAAGVMVACGVGGTVCTVQGALDLSEGGQDIYYGFAGSDQEARNPLKEAIGTEAYYNAEMIASGVCLCGMMGAPYIAPFAGGTGVTRAATAGAEVAMNRKLATQEAAAAKPKTALRQSPPSHGKNITTAQRLKAGNVDPVRDTKLAGNAMTRPKVSGVGKGAGKTTQWVDEAGNIKWPTNNGFDGAPTTETLKPGTIVDRYGGETGKFVSPKGTPYENRSLPPGSDARPYHVYEVVKSIDVKAGKIAAWFGQPGGGIQYQFTQSIEELIQSGYLRRLQ
jgi:hypothetical protein